MPVKDRKRPSLRSVAERNKLVEANLGLAPGHLIRVGVRLSDPEFDDLHQAALDGLIRAAELFDPSLGWKFSTYAECWIRQHVGRYKKSLPDRNVEQLPDYADKITPSREDDPERPVERNDDKRIAFSLLNCLDLRSRNVVVWRYLEGETLQGCADRMKTSKERIRQIQCKAMERLKREARRRGLCE